MTAKRRSPAIPQPLFLIIFSTSRTIVLTAAAAPSAFPRSSRAPASLWIILQDANGLRTYLPRQSPLNTGDNTGVTQAGYVHGETIALSTYGAAAFKVRIAGTQPGATGTVSIWGASI
jgi:hypothetical protein